MKQVICQIVNYWKLIIINVFFVMRAILVGLPSNILLLVIFIRNDLLNPRYQNANSIRISNLINISTGYYCFLVLKQFIFAMEYNQHCSYCNRSLYYINAKYSPVFFTFIFSVNNIYIR